MTEFRFGLMIRGTFPREDDMAVRFQEMMEQVRLIDRLGFDCLTKGSHYSTQEVQEFQQLNFLARAMAEGPNLRLNAGVVLLLLWKPLDLAEQLASLDAMSGGRMIFGCALGYRDVEAKAFGAHGINRVKRFTENLEAVKRLFTEKSVTMKGSHFELDDASISINPVQKPMPPVWIGANVDAAVARAARLGDCWYINPHQKLPTLVRQMEIYRRALDEAGKPFPEEFPIRRDMFVARTREEAMRIAEPHIADMYRVYRAWGQDKAMAADDRNLDLAWEDLVADRFLIGSPDEVAEQILTFHRKLGVNHLIASVQGTTMPQSQVLDTLHLMAEEVFPKVRQGM